MSSESIVFNHYSIPQAEPHARYVYSNDPVVQLDPIAADEGKQFMRHPRQRAILRDLKLQLDADSAVFGTDLMWACRGYIVQRLSSDSEDGGRGVKLGTLPAQAVSDHQRHADLEQIRFRSKPRHYVAPDQVAVDLYLFNVLVALEWIPDEGYLEQLTWAFRRASDFLYDVTDGCMAFGQVTFGGRELMECADVQVMASNRLHPRSWVSGLHVEQKYIPVRLGRALWSRRNRVQIPWDEPEGYRTFIHEWAHYALCLRDQYLNQEPIAKGKRLIVPDCTIASTTIMATLEGTSELVPHHRNGKHPRSEEWDTIVRWFPGLRPARRPLSGPGRLPLPLPVFHRVGSLAEQTPAAESPRLIFNTDEQRRVATEQPDRAWIYVLSTDPDGAPQCVLAQGTLDERSIDDGFELLGAQPGDDVLLIRHPNDTAPEVLHGTVQSARHVTLDRAPAIDAPPLIDVIPEIIDRPTRHDIAKVRVRVQSQSDDLPSAVWIVPFGHACDPIAMGRPGDADWISAACEVPTLDGQVLLQWRDGRRLIVTFSQGGGPPTHGPVTANPVTAGSSDGNIMLFFRDDEWRDPDLMADGEKNTDWSHLKVITTIMQGVESPDERGTARSYIYSVAGSAPLPDALSPTLVMYYDTITLSQQGIPRIERLDPDGWVTMNGLSSAGCGFVAIPLDGDTAAHLTDESYDGPRVERFRLVWGADPTA